MANSSFVFWNFLEFFFSEYCHFAVGWICICRTHEYEGPTVYEEIYHRNWLKQLWRLRRPTVYPLQAGKPEKSVRGWRPRNREAASIRPWVWRLEDQVLQCPGAGKDGRPTQEERGGTCPSFAFLIYLGSQRIEWWQTTLVRADLFIHSTESNVNLF